MGNEANQMLMNTISSLMNKGNRNRRKVFVFAVLLLVIAVIVLIGTTIGKFGSRRTGVRMGFVETSSSNSWVCIYSKFDGTMDKKLDFDTKEIAIEVKTSEGHLSMVVEDLKGNQLYKGTDMEDCSFTIGTDGPVKVKLTAENHKGSFSFKAK